MKIMIRAHDLGVKGGENIKKSLDFYGLDGIQLVMYKSVDSVKYERGSAQEQIALRIKEALSEKEIALLGAYFNPVHPNREKAELGEDIFKEYLAIAGAIGCPAVGSETGSLMGDPWGYHEDNGTDEALALAADSFRRLCDCAGQYGVNVAIEGAYNHVCRTPKRLSDCISLIGRENILVIVDLYNYLNINNYTDAYSILDSAIRLFSGKILLYHIKDFVVCDGGIKQCGVGKGILDFERIIRAIYRENKDAILVLEGTVGDDIPYAVKHLISIIKKINMG